MNLKTSTVHKCLLPAFALSVVVGLFTWNTIPRANAQSTADEQGGEVRAANLIYGKNRTSVCFADQFLADVETQFVHLVVVAINVVTGDAHVKVIAFLAVHARLDMRLAVVARVNKAIVALIVKFVEHRHCGELCSSKGGEF